MDNADAGDIFSLFVPLERCGPGDAASLRRVLARAGTPADGVILDAGCGTGGDLAVLEAAVPGGRVVAVDTAARFIEIVQARHPRIAAHVADMTDPPGGPFDLIWSAGAIYNPGVGAALRAWRAHLKPGGRVAFSDLCWRAAPNEAVRAFFAAEGVSLRSADALAAEVEGAGYRVLDAFWLGPEGWRAYYEPVERRLDGFAGDPGLIAGFRAEIALWQVEGASFDYRIVVAEPMSEASPGS